jgi:hypothetical protein
MTTESPSTNGYWVVIRDNRRIVMDSTFASDDVLKRWIRSLPNLDEIDHETTMY